MLLTQLLSASPLAVPAWAQDQEQPYRLSFSSQQQQPQPSLSQQAAAKHHHHLEQQFSSSSSSSRQVVNSNAGFVVHHQEAKQQQFTEQLRQTQPSAIRSTLVNTSNLRELPALTNWLEEPPDRVLTVPYASSLSAALNEDSNNLLGTASHSDKKLYQQKRVAIKVVPGEHNLAIRTAVTQNDYYEKRNVTNVYHKSLSSFANGNLKFGSTNQASVGAISSEAGKRRLSGVTTNNEYSVRPNGSSLSSSSYINSNNISSATGRNESDGYYSRQSITVGEIVSVRNNTSVKARPSFNNSSLSSNKNNYSSSNKSSAIQLDSKSVPGGLSTELSSRQLWSSYGVKFTIVTIGIIGILAFFGVVRCLRATSSRASRALALPSPLLQGDRTPLNAEPTHPVLMLSVQSPGYAGMERLGVPARTTLNSSAQVAALQEERNHHNRIMRADALQARELFVNVTNSSHSCSNNCNNVVFCCNTINSNTSNSCVKNVGLEDETGRCSHNITGDYDCHNRQQSIRLGSNAVQQPQYMGVVRCPHHVKLSDSEWGDRKQLQGSRTSLYQAEITRTYIKPPPNKTALDVPDSKCISSSHPSKYNSSSLLIFPHHLQAPPTPTSTVLSSSTSTSSSVSSHQSLGCLTVARSSSHHQPYCDGQTSNGPSSSKSKQSHFPFARFFKMGGGSGSTSSHQTSSKSSIRPDSPSRHHHIANSLKGEDNLKKIMRHHKMPTNSIPISQSTISLASTTIYSSTSVYADGPLSSGTTRSATNLASMSDMAVDSSRANNSNLTSNSSNGNNFCVYVTSSLSDNPSLSGGNGDGGSLSAQSYHQHNHHGRPNNTLGCDIDDPNHGLERLCCSVNNINNNSCNNYSAGECISGSVLSIKNRNIDNQSRCDKRNFEDIAPSLQSGDCRRGGGGHGEGGEGELSDCDDVENLSTRHI